MRVNNELVKPKYEVVNEDSEPILQQSENDLAELRKPRGQHLLSKEQVLSYESIRSWLGKLPEPRSKETVQAYVWVMQLYTDFIGKTPDQLIEERNVELGSKDLLIRTTAERNLDKFIDSYPTKTSVVLIARAIQSFYKKNRMKLESITVPNDDAIAVRTKDRIPTDREIRLMCDNCDMRDRLLLLVAAQTGMRIGSLVLLQYKHLKEDLEEGLIPCKVKVPQYEREYDRLGSMTFICADTVALLKDYLATRKRQGETIGDESWMFLRHELSPEREHIRDAGVWEVLKREARKVGLRLPLIRLVPWTIRGESHITCT